VDRPGQVAGRVRAAGVRAIRTHVRPAACKSRSGVRPGKNPCLARTGKRCVAPRLHRGGAEFGRDLTCRGADRRRRWRMGGFQARPRYLALPSRQHADDCHDRARLRRRIWPVRTDPRVQSVDLLGREADGLCDPQCDAALPLDAAARSVVRGRTAELLLFRARAGRGVRRARGRPSGVCIQSGERDCWRRQPSCSRTSV
jgi:hypothetical protein